MKYIRTKDGIYERIMVVRQVCDSKEVAVIRPDKVEFEPIIKQADTIEELCDEFVVVPDQDLKPFIATQFVRDGGSYTCSTIYGAIWTDKGLIYKAKMNDKGELELI